MSRRRLIPARLRRQVRERVRTTVLEVVRSENPRVAKGYRRVRLVARTVGSRVTGRQLGWVAHLRRARWTGPTTFEIAGWAYERGYGHVDGPPRTRVWLERDGQRVDADVTMRYDPEVNAAAPAGSEHDYGNTAFTATLELGPLLATRGSEPWVVHVRVIGAGRDRTGTFTSRYRFGSVRHLFASTQDDDTQLIARWAGGARGLTLRRHRPEVVARELTIEGRRLSVLVSTTGASPTGASVRSGEALDALTCTAAGSDEAGRALFRLEGDVPSGTALATDREAPLSLERGIVVHTADGATVAVATDLDADSPRLWPSSTLLVSATGDGRLLLVDAPGRVLVDDVSVSERPPGLVLHGRYVLGDVLGTAVEEGRTPELVVSGSRQVLPVQATFTPAEHGQGTWQAFAPLLAPVWDRQPLPPRLGGYVLRARTPDGVILPVTNVPGVTRRMPEMHHLEGFRLRLQSGGGRSMRFGISPPRRDDEVGSFHQRRLERLYRRRSWSPRNAVYLESFYGRAATCNPRAIDRELAARYPQLTRFWGVTDASVPTPPGAITVVRGTREWWHARATSRYVVANDWLRRTFHPQPFQVVLQTWHGSMLKRIGLDRSGQPKSKIATIRLEQSKWDVLLSQNHHSSVILESAYDWHETLFEEGYPRNDPLTPGSPYAGDGAAIRAQLGIRPDQTAVLYAPTWRENLTTMVTFLDLERLSADLGPSFVVLLRGHSRTVKFGASLDDLPGVIDVTTHPEVTDLFLAADALITDYSSVMFDYSVTRRPMIFFVPDMDDYRSSLRGVYFDLSEVAPGPVLSTQDEVVTALRELDRAGERYAAAYDTWVERFNHHDDGRSAERVVRRLLAIRK